MKIIDAIKQNKDNVINQYLDYPFVINSLHRSYRYIQSKELNEFLRTLNKNEYIVTSYTIRFRKRSSMALFKLRFSNVKK